MKKIVVYDFDKTLTYKDTLFGFFRHAAQPGLLYYPKLTIYMAGMVMSKFGLMDNTTMKSMGVSLFLKDLDEETLYARGRDYGKNIAFNTLYETLTYHENSEYVVISASFEAYLRPLFPEKVRVFGSQLQYEGDRVCGLGLNCYKQEKVKRLQEAGISHIDVLYTDSYSDAALAKIADKTIVVAEEKLVECHSIEEFREYFQR